MADSLEAWHGLGSATVSDALDCLGIAGQCHGLSPIDRRLSFVGRAFTLRMAPADSAAGTVGDYIDRVSAGEVVVIDNQARTDCTVWGDLLTEASCRRSVAGTVIDGVCRDLLGALARSYPLFTRGVHMRSGKGRVVVAEEGGPAAIAGVRVERGDLLLGDADGVVVVPLAEEVAVLHRAREIAAMEGRIRNALAEGVSLAEARARHGYHDVRFRGGRE